MNKKDEEIQTAITELKDRIYEEWEYIQNTVDRSFELLIREAEDLEQTIRSGK